MTTRAVLAGVLVLLALQDRGESQVGSDLQPVAINEILTNDPAAPGAQFIELFNVTDEPVDLVGWRLQVWRSGSITDFVLSGVVPRRGYFLIVNPLSQPFYVPSADLVLPFNMGTIAGSLVLRGPTQVVSDTVGWGITSGPVEGAPAPNPPSGQSIARSLPGFDTDNNSADFRIQNPPSPKNSTDSQEPNLPPVFDPIPSQTVSEGATLALIVTAYDPEGGLVTLQADVLPAGATFDPSTGVFSWVPFFGAAQGNPYFVTFIATDDQGLRSGLTVEIRVVLPAVVVAITSPTSDPTYATTFSSITLSGTVSNVPAVQSVTWSNAATGGAGTANGVSPWSALIPLKAGDNAIQVSALGVDGVLGTSSILVTYTPPDGGVLLTAPAQISARMLVLTVNADVATSGDVGKVYLGGQVLVLAPDGSVRDSTGILPVIVSNASRVVLSYTQKTALSKAKAGDSMAVTVTLTGLKTGQVTFAAADAAVVKVGP
jgi:hypothetical protein